MLQPSRKDDLSSAPTARELARLGEDSLWANKYPNLATHQGVSFDGSTSLLIAHPDERVRFKLAIALRGQHWHIHFFGDGFGILNWLAADLVACTDSPSSKLIIADAQLTGTRGIDLLTTLRRAGSQAPFILLTPHRSRTLAAKIRHLGGVLVFDTSFENDDLLTAVCYLLRRSTGLEERFGVPAATAKSCTPAASQNRLLYPSQSGMQSA